MAHSLVGSVHVIASSSVAAERSVPRLSRELPARSLSSTRESLAASRRALEAGAIAFPSRDEALANWRRERRDVIEELARGAGPITLGFSGGTDSRILARDLVALGHRPRLLCLASSEATRDHRHARAGAAELGLPLSAVLVGDADLRRALDSCAGLLSRLADTTQRVLALAEGILMAAVARADEGELWTGHGPESILGGFHRRPSPGSHEIERMVASIELNTRRLSAVRTRQSPARPLVCPFYQPRMLRALRRLNVTGLGHGDLEPGAPAKASLQNGSGIHYRLERIAREDGHSRLSTWFAERLDLADRETGMAAKKG